MKDPAILGHIDCPTCGTAGAMRITHDKNGDPFGYCEDGCSQQLRIGGKPARVRKFLARYPWAAGPATEPAPAPAPAKKPAPATPEETAAILGKPVTATAPAPATATKKRATWADGLAALGVR